MLSNVLDFLIAISIIQAKPVATSIPFIKFFHELNFQETCFAKVNQPQFVRISSKFHAKFLRDTFERWQKMEILPIV